MRHCDVVWIQKSAEFRCDFRRLNVKCESLDLNIAILWAIDDKEAAVGVVDARWIRMEIYCDSFKVGHDMKSYLNNRSPTMGLKYCFTNLPSSQLKLHKKKISLSPQSLIRRTTKEKFTIELFHFHGQQRKPISYRPCAPMSLRVAQRMHPQECGQESKRH